MFLFLLFFLHKIYFSISLKEPTNKCINCKFFLKPIPPFPSEFSKCNLYPKYNLNANELQERKRKDLLANSSHLIHVGFVRY